MTDCVFCEIAADRNRSEVCVSELDGTPTVVWFEPLGPVTRGHRLFIPVAHHSTADQVPSCLLGDVFRSAAEWGAQGDYNLIQSNGVHATQTIAHVHVHLVPRIPGDGLHLPWTDS